MSLANKVCVPCEVGAPPATAKQIETWSSELSGDWKVADGKLIRTFSFDNFVAAVAFVNKVAEVAELQGHHPEILVHDYKKVTIRLWTHKIEALHRNDFVLAAKIDQL